MEKKVDTQKVKDVITDSAKKTGSAAVKVIIDTKNAISNITVEDVLRQAMKVPLVKINREKFLRKELIKYFPEDIVNLSIEKNPAFAGVERERVNKIATHIINFESNKVTAISAAAGIPGGAAMAATIPADLTQYFSFNKRSFAGALVF